LSESARIVEVVTRHLSRPLGPNSAKIAVKTFATRSAGKTTETLTVSDLPKLLDGIRPMLAVMAGKARADQVIDEIRQDLGYRE
jgi:hypothetical protein